MGGFSSTEGFIFFYIALDFTLASIKDLKS